MQSFVDFLSENTWVGLVFALVLLTLAARYAAKLAFDRLARQLERTLFGAGCSSVTRLLVSRPGGVFLLPSRCPDVQVPPFLARRVPVMRPRLSGHGILAS